MVDVMNCFLKPAELKSTWRQTSFRATFSGGICKQSSTSTPTTYEDVHLAGEFAELSKDQKGRLLLLGL